MSDEKKHLILPMSVVSPTDIARLLRELDNLDEFFRQDSIRHDGEAALETPRYSRLLDELLVTNKVDLLDAQQREKLVTAIRLLEQKAPVLHISFSVDPPGPYIQKIVSWLRESIHPFVLVRVGLQPNIGAGCVVRTTNKSFDFSLRRFFDKKRDFFIEKLHEALVEDGQQDQPSKEESAATPQAPQGAAA